MRNVVFKLNIEILLSVPAGEIAASKKDKNKHSINKISNVKIPEFLVSVKTEIVKSLMPFGFDPMNGAPTTFSERNGGFSMYDAYVMITDEVQVKAILNVRVSNHLAQPSLQKRNALRLTSMRDQHEEIKNGTADAYVLDVYCKLHDWDDFYLVYDPLD